MTTDSLDYIWTPFLKRKTWPQSGLTTAKALDVGLPLKMTQTLDWINAKMTETSRVKHTTPVLKKFYWLLVPFLYRIQDGDYYVQSPLWTEFRLSEGLSSLKDTCRATKIIWGGSFPGAITGWSQDGGNKGSSSSSSAMKLTPLAPFLLTFSGCMKTERCRQTFYITPCFWSSLRCYCFITFLPLSLFHCLLVFLVFIVSTRHF